MESPNQKTKETRVEGDRCIKNTGRQVQTLNEIWGVFKPFYSKLGFPGGSAVRNPAAKAGDTDSIPRLGRSPGEGNDNTLQSSLLENPTNRGPWWATVLQFMGLQKSQTQFSD